MEIIRIKTEAAESGEVFVRQFSASEIAITGMKDAALILGVHINTVRRWADKGIIKGKRLPTGVRRLELESVMDVYGEMYGESES